MTHHRLVSAYEDKVAPESGYPRVRALLQRRYGGVSFPNFARLVAARAARRCGGGGVVEGGAVDRCRLNIHWLPLVSRCGYCDLSYTVIARPVLALVSSLLFQQQNIR